LSSLDVVGVHLDNPFSGLSELGHLSSADSVLLFVSEEGLSDSEVSVSSAIGSNLSSEVSSPFSEVDLVGESGSSLSDDSEISSLAETSTGSSGVVLDDSLPAEALVDSVEGGEFDALLGLISSDANSLSWVSSESGTSSDLLSRSCLDWSTWLNCGINNNWQTSTKLDFLD